MKSFVQFLIIYGLCCFFNVDIDAKERNRQDINTIALESLSHFSGNKKELNLTDIKLIATSSDFFESQGGRVSFYVFGFSNNTPGYVIVSADDVLPAVLGFSEKEHFCLTKDLEEPNGFDYMLHSFALTKENADVFKQTNNHTRSTRANYADVDPLLGDIAFDQGAPYNEMCPKTFMGDCENGTAMPTGCVATAAAQIMAYYQWPLQMTGRDISYTSYSYQIPVTWETESTYFNWHNILPEYNSLMWLDKEDYTFGEPIMGIINNYYELYNGQDKLEVYVGNPFDTDLAIAFQVWIAEDDGTLLQPVSKIEYFSIETGVIIHSNPVDFICPTSLVDGNYRLYCCAKILGTNEWHLCLYNDFATPEYYDKNYLELTKTGNTFSIGNSSLNCKSFYGEEQIQEISKLNAAIGAAVEMDYTSVASGSFMNNLLYALTNYFGYDQDIKMIERKTLNDAAVHDCLYKELAVNRPVYLAGGGHAFVLDGCKQMGSEIYYHINWGWGGRSNGYYLIDYLTPAESGIGGNSQGVYSSNLNIIIGIQPENGKQDTYNY